MKKLLEMVGSKHIKTFLKLAISVLLLYLLVVTVDWEKSWKVVQSIDIILLGIYGILVFAGIIISSYKWKIISTFCGFSHSLVQHIRWYIAGTFVNNFLPSIVGGDTYRALSLGKYEGRRSPAIASVLFDRYTGLVAMAIMAVGFSVVNIAKVVEHPLWIVLFFGALLGVGLQFFLFPGKRWSFFALVSQFFPKKADRIRETLEQFQEKYIISTSLLWGSVFAFIGVGLANYVLFLAFGISLSLIDFLSVIFFINIISALPLSINNIGVKEWAYFVFFGFLGVAPEFSVTVAIVSRFVQMIISLFGIPTFFQKKNL
jgi:uncharacterized protein (TIRG00374 family)